VSASSRTSGLIKTLLILVALLVGLTAATVAVALTASSCAPVSSTVASGGIAFSAAVSLVLLIESTAGLFKDVI
jgi:hypothetical protein